MELCFRDNDPTSTVLIDRDGRPLYRVVRCTQKDDMVITIQRFAAQTMQSIGHVASEVGLIEHDLQSSSAKVRFRENDSELVLHHDSGDLECSWAFTGPDGRPYKWQIFIKYPILFLNDNSNKLIARYRRAKIGIISRPRRAFLEILPDGIDLIDFTVVTFVFFAKKYMISDIECGSNS